MPTLRCRVSVLRAVVRLRLRNPRRSALRLWAYSHWRRDFTRSRFLNEYGIPDGVFPGDKFRTAVLELVRLVQTALYIFGAPEFANIDLRDGLLCDVTEHELSEWSNQIGEKLLGLEVREHCMYAPTEPLQPPERLLDPAHVSGMLSTIINVRNKLATIQSSPVCYFRDACVCKFTFSACSSRPV